MSLTRVFTTVRQVLIRKLGDAGGMRADDASAELDNIIAWAKDSPRCIHTNASAVGNVGVGLDSLHSFSLPAGSLATNGDYLHVRYKGDFANNANSKRIRTSIDNQATSDTGAFVIGGAEWVYDVYYFRVSATSVRASVLAMNGFITRDQAGTVGGNAFIFATGPAATVANLNSNAVTVLVQAEATANDDVTQSLSIIELRQQ